MRGEAFWPAPSAEPEPPPPGAFQPREAPAPLRFRLRGLAFAGANHLVAGSLEPPGLLVFDCLGGGPPLFKPWPAGDAFHPWDMAATADGCLHILDLPLEGEAGPSSILPPDAVVRHRALGPTLDPVRAQRHILDLPPGDWKEFLPGMDVFPLPDPGERLRWEAALDALQALRTASDPFPILPTSLEPLPDGSVLVLAQPRAGDFSLLLRYRHGVLLGLLPLAGALSAFRDREAGEEGGGENPAGADLRAHDLAFPGCPAEGSRVEGILFLADEGGNQSFAFRFLDRGGPFFLALQPRYYPMRRYRGRGLEASRGAVYYDLEDRWVELAEQVRPRHEPVGEVEGPVWDGKVPECLWHRILLDAVLPAGTSVEVHTRSAGSPEALREMPWRREPDPLRRPGGSEQPFHRPFAGRYAAAESAGTLETLIQQSRARYLQARLVLKGTGRATPLLRAVRAYYPRFSYLERYLPAIYRQDKASGSFLDRFLANPEGLFTALEDRIAAAHLLFDPAATPAEYLDWLAGWLGLAVEESWEPFRKRLLLRHAMTLFRQKGTVPGMLRAVRLATDPCPDDRIFAEAVADCDYEEAAPSPASRRLFGVRIVEDFRLRRAPGSVFGDPSRAEGPGLAPAASPWTPSMGAEALHRRFREALERRYAEPASLAEAWGGGPSAWEEARLSPLTPPPGRARADRRAFLDAELGAGYADVAERDAPLFRDFLSQRYASVADLNRAYALSSRDAHGSFRAVPLPREFPSAGRPLEDWMLFVSRYLPTVRLAHRFRVLVPRRADDAGRRTGPDPAVVRRVVELEKPAHSQFELREFWAYFQVGHARLGLDTQVHRGTRLLPGVVGALSLGEAHLAHPPAASGRLVLDRDRMASSRMHLPDPRAAAGAARDTCCSGSQGAPA